MRKVLIFILNFLYIHHANGNYKNNLNITETENNLLFHVIKFAFLKKPFPVYKLQILALYTVHTENCKPIAEHSSNTT